MRRMNVNDFMGMMGLAFSCSLHCMRGCICSFCVVRGLFSFCTIVLIPKCLVSNSDGIAGSEQLAELVLVSCFYVSGVVSCFRVIGVVHARGSCTGPS